MARQRYNPAAIDARRSAVAAYRVRGYSQRQITEALPEGLPARRDPKTDKVTEWAIPKVLNHKTEKPFDLATINRDVQSLEESWLESASASTETLKAQLLASIRYAVKEAWRQNKLYYVFRGYELEMVVLGLDKEPGEDLGQLMGAFLTGVRDATEDQVEDLSEPPGPDPVALPPGDDEEIPDLSE